MRGESWSIMKWFNRKAVSLSVGFVRRQMAAKRRRFGYLLRDADDGFKSAMSFHEGRTAKMAAAAAVRPRPCSATPPWPIRCALGR